MKRLRTLRARFALWTAGLLLVVLAAFGVYIYASTAQGMLSAVDDALTLGASQVIAGLEIENGQLILPESVIEEPEIGILQARGLTVRILSPQGQVLQAFGPYQALPVSTASGASFATRVDPTGRATVRVYTVPVEENNRSVVVVHVAQSIEEAQVALRRLLLTLLVSLPLLVVIAGIGGYFLAGRALAPIDRITRTARRISAEDLSDRLNLPATDDEVGRLAETFDAMLARLDESFRRERQFTADASHELRTPLAAMQAILSVVREERRTPEDYEQALADLADETDRLRALTENLLRLARSDTRQRAPRRVIDLSTLLRDVADSMRPLAETKGLSITRDVPDSLMLTGDRDDLIRMFVNLLDNGIKYTERGGITVSAGQYEDHGLSIIIADTGIGIAAEHFPHIFDRFYRVDKSRTRRGSGLGLAIALDIARDHSGTIETRSTLGEGTIFTVRLPRG